MLIHANGESRNAFEHIVILLCQSSLHTALHISFILFAALEDYQEEDMQGKPNPAANPVLFAHIARILHIVERAVVQGDLVSILVENVSEFTQDEHTFRKQFAQDIIQLSLPVQAREPPVPLKSGSLLYKKAIRQSFQRKLWKERWFCIQDKVLYCYHDQNFTRLRRALPLQDCRIELVDNKHHENCFEIFSPITNTLFKLQAHSREDMMEWISALNSYGSHLVISDLTVSVSRRVIRSTPQTAQTSSLDNIFKLANRNKDVEDDLSDQDSVPSRITSGAPKGDDDFIDAVPISPTTAHALLKTTSVRYTSLVALQQKRYLLNCFVEWISLPQISIFLRPESFYSEADRNLRRAKVCNLFLCRSSFISTVDSSNVLSAKSYSRNESLKLKFLTAAT